MKLLVFPHILPGVIIVRITENPMLFRRFKVELRDRGFFNSGNRPGKSGVHYMYATEGKTQWILARSGDNPFLSPDVLPTAQPALLTVKQKIALRLSVPNRQRCFCLMTCMIVNQFRKVYIRQNINIIEKQ